MGQKNKENYSFLWLQKYNKRTKAWGNHGGQRKTISLLQHEKTFFNYKFLYHPTEKAYVAYSEDKYDYAY